MYRFNYDRIKDKNKIYYDIDDDYAQLLEPVISMFIQKGLPETFNFDYFLNYLLTEGWACLGPGKDGEIAALHFRPAGNPDANGIGKTAIITSDNGFSTQIENWRESKTYIACHLNKIYSPDLNLAKTAAFLAQVDVSTLNLIKQARFSKIFACPNTKVEQAVKEAFKNAENGQAMTVVAEEQYLQIKNTDGSIKAIDITDPNIATRIQYLMKTQDDILRGFYNRYGLSSYGTGKMAQLTEEEATAGENRAEVIPDSRLSLLKEWVEKVNAAYNYNATVDYSAPWKEEHLKKEENTDEKVEHTEDSAEQSEGSGSGGDNDEPAGETVDTE